MLRKLALHLPVLAFLAVGVAAPVLGQTSMRAISDFSYLRSDLRSLDQRVEDFITDVRAGNRQAFKYVQYETVEAAIVRLKREADQYPATRTLQDDRTMRYLVATTASDEEQARATLTRATLPGIFNMDPRVRLVATDWLRGIRPDAAMQRAVKLAIGVDVEVIRYDHQRGEFVFRAPRILETVASAYEYYREKDLDWPTSLQVGDGTTRNTGGRAWRDGQGPNNNEELLYQEAPQLRDGGENIVNGLSARRFGSFEPRYDTERGYLPLTQAEREAVYAEWMAALERALDGYTMCNPSIRNCDPNNPEHLVEIPGARDRFGADIFAPELDMYRHYPLDGTRDEEGVRQGAQLLFEQYYQQGEMVPLGQGAKYIYMDRNARLMIGNPWAQLTKLDEFITRKVWWDKIKAGQNSVMTFISKDTFSTLYRSIDGEIPEWIPMLSFHTNQPMIERNNPAVTDRMVDTLIVGLHRNPVLSNRYAILRALKSIYADRFNELDTTPATREKINVALWEFRREANRLDYVAGRELMAEAITVGLRPANDWVPILPVSAAQDDLETVLDLGFRLPNDEIRAASYRLISTLPTNDADPSREAKVNIDDRFRAVFYAWRRPDGNLVTWYNNRSEWIARAAGQDVTANVQSVDSPWIYNYDQMTRSQNLINAILAGDPDVMRTITWPDMEGAIILTLKRVQLMYERAGAAAAGVVTTFMDQLRRQDVIVDNPAARNNDTIRERMFVDEAAYLASGNLATNTFSEEKREAIKTAALGGLFNRDPRIRLTAIHFMRRLGPDESMLDAIVRARSIVTAGANEERTVDAPETDDYLNSFIDTNIYERDKSKDFVTEFRNRYRGVIPDERLNDADNTLQINVLNPTYTIEGHEYQLGMISSQQAENGTLIRYFGLYQIKSPGEELDKLYRYIQRRRMVRMIKRGDVNAITRMSRADFGVMSEFIDDEYAARVPFISLHTTAQDRSARTALPSRFAVFNENDVAVIKRGIDSTNFLVQKGTAEYLIQFYNFYTGFNADSPVKREIRDAMYFYKQDDIAVEEFVLAFEGENPDGRAVIMAGTNLSRDLNPGGERVYRTLPDNILMDIRDAVLDEVARLPESLRAILGMITARASDASADLTYRSRDQNSTVRSTPAVPTGPQSTPPATTAGGAAPAPAPAAGGAAPAPAPAAGGTTTP